VVCLSPWRAAVASDSPDPQLVLGFYVRKRAGARQHAFLQPPNEEGVGKPRAFEHAMGQKSCGCRRRRPKARFVMKTVSEVVEVSAPL
jgi:hypothetical protein